MNIQVIGTKKCKNTQKALRFFKERGLKPHFKDLGEGALKAGEVRNILRSITPEELIDREGKLYEKMNLQYIQHDPVEKILEEPFLMKTPVVRCEGKSVVGLDTEGWKELIKK